MSGLTKSAKKGRPLATLFLLLLLLGSGGLVLQRFLPIPATFLMTSRMIEGEGWDYRWRSLDRISPRLVQAVIASEDSTFCTHRGFDMKAIEKALKANERGGRIRGGSTISQQTAKNVFLWPGRDWIRKGLEAGYTVAIETVWGKRRIMEVYLNVAEWAPGVYGAEAAAQHWFGKSAAGLSAPESARLAAILPSPRRYDAASPGPYVRRRASRIQAAMGTVREQGLDACVLG
ncbi:MAG: monofunctional biosynthetic peptidoglycan transglycosylase [Brevundimonas sp.]|uniref:monofunctional biosynthetic peptidoglycan transglycosylase n=1 Tax=Brevundimonas sp. TaxID=1871086 RepID=UPI002717D38B|nr:monofunctional biosynthetic peptidoglycan transglycosylase [Brevundimonas sp.]MDO9587707.1 monofunctional biosynthetic peptidoglycan transglycosylase [Brevundimonas sp.]MDP3656145.1 monofunctional biosynthetic peptidoglycan transglycosylase [Brevundimonas sp.]MDZ4109167.1 monofunctional biosynthetic peptidoglycan transglycosylase [Brevundimonas sp.]